MQIAQISNRTHVHLKIIMTWGRSCLRCALGISIWQSYDSLICFEQMDLTCPSLEMKNARLFLRHLYLWGLTPNISISLFWCIIFKMMRYFIPQLYTVCWEEKSTTTKPYPEKKLISTRLSSAKISGCHESINRQFWLICLCISEERTWSVHPSVRSSQTTAYLLVACRCGRGDQVVFCACTVRTWRAVHFSSRLLCAFAPHCTPTAECTGFASSRDISGDGPAGATVWVRAPGEPGKK